MFSIASPFLISASSRRSLATFWPFSLASMISFSFSRIFFWKSSRCLEMSRCSLSTSSRNGSTRPVCTRPSRATRHSYALWHRPSEVPSAAWSTFACWRASLSASDTSKDRDTADALESERSGGEAGTSSVFVSAWSGPSGGPSGTSTSQAEPEGSSTTLVVSLIHCASVSPSRKSNWEMCRRASLVAKACMRGSRSSKTLESCCNWSLKAASAKLLSERSSSRVASNCLYLSSSSPNRTHLASSAWRAPSMACLNAFVFASS
mmetsp:Transcript_37370/g.87683  ORF Transcript_37370/g.87683 Transcript_37370/m.87683 type:complete len:263 (+) Transcript_37370:1677-2465(+)